MSAIEKRSSHPLAQIYLARALDPVIEIAEAVSEDFIRRTYLYTKTPDDIATLLANFRTLRGKHSEWPDAAQRTLTSSFAISRFFQAFASIRLAAIQSDQHGSGRGDGGAQKALADLASRLRASVRPLEGAALSAVAKTNAGMLERAVTLLTSIQVSSAFGVGEIATGDWPDRGLFSPQLGYLCESVSGTLKAVSGTLKLHLPVRQPALAMLQSAGHYGSVTIDRVLDPTFDDSDRERNRDVIYAASAWARALSEILSRIDIARAWKDPTYRGRLFPLEKDMMPPHPSGEISLDGLVKTDSPRFRPVRLGYSTETVAHEICCCTGDLICSNSNGDCGTDFTTEDPTLTSILI